MAIRPRRKRISLVPRLTGPGGPASFQARLARGLAAREVEVCFDPGDTSSQAILVIGGTRHLAGLWRAKRRRIPIVQRLDGMNWLHRLRPTGLRHYLRSEYGNLILRFIRKLLADQVVYQSHFARRWWERAHGPTPVPAHVVYNGVDLNEFSPNGPHQRPGDRVRLLMVEGNLMGGYELGLEQATEMAERLAQTRAMPIELVVAGRVPARTRADIERRAGVPVRWAGYVPRERIPEMDRSAHLLFAADLNAACPNAVVEALACGLPVASFATGALPEMVDEKAGRLAPYGGDPWKLDPPDFEALAAAAGEILDDQLRFRQGARARAEAIFGLDAMVDSYLHILLTD